MIDPVNSDPPPPYGPPTYDQVVAEKETEISGADLEQSIEENVESEHATSEELNEREPGGDTESDRGPEQYISHGYQDMPSVTI